MKNIHLTAKRGELEGKYILVETTYPPSSKVNIIGRVYRDGSFSHNCGTIIYPDVMERLNDICNNFHFYFDNIKEA